MLWFGFAVLAAVIWTFVDVLDKFVVEKELNDPVLAAGVCGMGIFLTLAVISLIFGDLVLSLKMMVPSILAAVFYSFALLLYFSGMQREEVSRFAPTLALSTVFIVIVAYLFLDETFSAVIYLGILSVIVGTILISLESWKKLQSKKGLALGVAAALFFGFREVFLKSATNKAGVLSVLIWMGITGTIVSIFFILYRGPKISNDVFKGEEHLLGIGFLSSIGYFAFAISIFLGPVSLASTVLKIKVFLVFIVSSLISKLHPKMIHEELDRRVLVQKLISVFLIMIGVILIQLYAW